MVKCSTERPGRTLQFNVKENCRSYQANGGAVNTDFMMYSCVFNGMNLSMLLCFHWNVFNIHKQMLSDYTLI